MTTEQTPGILHNQEAGFREVVTRDTASIYDNNPQLRLVEEIYDFDRKLIGFRVYDKPIAPVEAGRGEREARGEKAFSAAALIEKLRIEYGDEKAKALIDQCACILAGHRNAALSQGNGGEAVAAQPQQYHSDGRKVGRSKLVYDKANRTIVPQNAAPSSPPEGVREGLAFWYRNYRGEIAQRRVTVLGLRYGSSQFHHEAQWLLRAFDLDKQAEREFAIKDMAPMEAMLNITPTPSRGLGWLCLPWSAVPSHVAEGPTQIRARDGWLVCELPGDGFADFIVCLANETALRTLSATGTANAD